MADSIEVFGFCNANCRHRVLTIDQTINLIQEMAANGFQVPEGFIPTTAVNSIIEQNTGKAIKLFVGTQAEYDSWTGDKTNVFTIISDDPALKEFLTRLDNLENAAISLGNSIDDILDGTTPPKNAINAIKNSDGTFSGLTHTSNKVLKVGEEIIEKKVLLYNKEKNELTSTSYIATLSTDVIKVGDKVEIEYVEYNKNATTGTEIFKTISESSRVIVPNASGIVLKQDQPYFTLSYINEEVTKVYWGVDDSKELRINIGDNAIEFTFGSAEMFNVLKFDGSKYSPTKNGVNKTFLITKVYKIIE